MGPSSPLVRLGGVWVDLDCFITVSDRCIWLLHSNKTAGKGLEQKNNNNNNNNLTNYWSKCKMKRNGKIEEEEIHKEHKEHF